MKKKAQLVCQHLESISRSALEEHQDIVRQYVRGRQGVYALYRRGKLYYVGLATNLRNRLKHHLKDRHGLSWDRGQWGQRNSGKQAPGIIHLS